MNIQKESPGFRIVFAEDDYLEMDCARYTGIGNVTDAIECMCPNCGKDMFPAINLKFPDPMLSSIVEWKAPFLRILFCPSCALYMAPYWIKHVGEKVEIIGGYRDGGEILQNIETPYLCREISLKPLDAGDYPVDEEKLEKLLARSRDPGVYHQIGGLPIKGHHDRLNCCNCEKEMKFLGILDYDDLNVPLYENDHIPVALIIGDYDSLNIFSCEMCSVIGMRWAT